MQLTLDSPYGINDFTWGEAIAKYYTPVITSPDKRWIMYYGRTNEHAVLDHDTGELHRAFGYNIRGVFHGFTGIDYDVINAAEDIYYAGGNDLYYWRNKWIKAVWIDNADTFITADGQHMEYKIGDTVCGYVDNDNRFTFFSLAGVPLNHITHIEELSKDAVLEFNRKCGYEWYNNCFSSIYLDNKYKRIYEENKKAKKKA